MKSILLLLTAAGVSVGNLCANESSCNAVFIGTAGLGHVSPAASAPFGMIQAGPDTSVADDRPVNDWAHASGYQHGDEWVWRFSQTHLSGTGCNSFNDIGILPHGDNFATNRPARLVKSTERAAPGRYRATLDVGGTSIDCEIAALERTALYRFTYPEQGRAKLYLDLLHGMGRLSSKPFRGRHVSSPVITFTSDRTVRGGHAMWNWNDYEIYFAMEFSSPVLAHTEGPIADLDFGVLPGRELLVKVALSFTSPEAAERNLRAEMSDFDFAAASNRAASAWRRELSRVTLGSDTPADISANFRAALYRTMLQPNLISDVGEAPRYSTFSLWDTFRAAHPLYTILAAPRVSDFVNSMLEQYDRQGYLPIWALAGRDNHCMIGHHSVPVIVDAYLKGFTGVDWQRAFAAIDDSLSRNHRASNRASRGLLKEDFDLLDRYGYYPFDKLSGEKVKGESVSRLLECTYDDACAARMAASLGHDDRARFFAARANSWTNVYDASTGFMRGRDSQGRWREPFNPYALGHGALNDNDYTEGNAWQYSWHVLHDPEGLFRTLGGHEAALAKLDGLFTARALDAMTDGNSQDVSGMIGQYAHGNEPSHHVAYLYTLLGHPEKTAEIIRKVFATQYSPRPDGLCGNDDCGQMAAWYIFSALGFYPVDPCGGDYVVGAPQVPSATVRLPNGKTLAIRAEGKSAHGVKEVWLNGRKLPSFILRHADLLAGGELVFK